MGIKHKSIQFKFLQNSKWQKERIWQNHNHNNSTIPRGKGYGYKLTGLCHCTKKAESTIHQESFLHMIQHQQTLAFLQAGFYKLYSKFRPSTSPSWNKTLLSHPICPGRHKPNPKLTSDSTVTWYWRQWCHKEQIVTWQTKWGPSEDFKMPCVSKSFLLNLVRIWGNLYLCPCVPFMRFLHSPFGRLSKNLSAMGWIYFKGSGNAVCNELFSFLFGLRKV